MTQLTELTYTYFTENSRKQNFKCSLEFSNGKILSKRLLNYSRSCKNLLSKLETVS